MARHPGIITIVEGLFTALFFALILAVGVMSFVIGPRIRGVLEESGRAMPRAVEIVLSQAWWPLALGLLLAAAAAAVSSHSARVRRGALASGLLTGVAAIAIYAALVLGQTDITDLVTEGQKPVERTPPKQLLPGP